MGQTKKLLFYIYDCFTLCVHLYTEVTKMSNIITTIESIIIFFSMVLHDIFVNVFVTIVF